MARRGRPGWHIECSVIAQEFLDLPLTVNGGADREPAREPVLAHRARGLPRREDEQVPRQPRARLLARRLGRRRAGDSAGCALAAVPRRLGVDGPLALEPLRPGVPPEPVMHTAEEWAAYDAARRRRN